MHLVGGGHDEHCTLALGHPGQQVTQHAPRHAAILATAAGQALLDLVDPQHARGQLLGRGQCVAQVLLRFAVVLVVQGAEVQAQQRYFETGRGGLGQHRLAAALHAQQQHALGRVQPRRGVAADEDRAALLDPALEAAGTGDVAEARAVVFVVQMAAAVEQLELQFRQLRQVAGVERAVGEDQLTGDASRVQQVQALQVAHDLPDRFLLGLDAASAVLAHVVGRLFAHHLEQRVGVGQARAETHRQRLQVFGQLDLRPHQHHHVRLAVPALHDVAQLALAAGVAQVGMEIEQQVDAALVGLLHRLQRGAGI